ncbi:MAG TPA: adenylate/guanylate cyclase domain-containing protein [Mycobacteriales bacterium]|nr:adenylate/guanylate cyclase domain-containing protein [Mycobacteriales bacterium]
MGTPVGHELPTGVLTFLFTDIMGSTELLRSLGESYSDVLATHHELIRAAIADHHGYEVDTEGDAFFVVFTAASDAVAAALSAQQSLQAHPWPGAPVRVRMGLHTGVAALTSTGYVGMAIHEAARVASAAHGDQVVLSEATRAAVGPDLPAEATLRDLGLHRLKDFAEPQHLHQLCHPALPADMPPLRTLGAHNLPSPATSFLGRGREIADLSALLVRDDVRLVTASGPGGVGKTRLALAVGAAVAARFHDGVRLVELAAIADSSTLPAAIADAVGLPELQGDRRDVVDRLRDLDLLLVLDNFEHVLDGAALVARILTSCPGITVLVTSQAVLAIQGEHVFTVPVLAVPSSDDVGLDALQDCASVDLFEARAREALPGFRITPDSAPAVAELCRRLDGLPLAIELVVPWLKLFQPAVLLDRLDDRLELLRGGPDREARHRTLKAAIGWSYDLLGEAEQALLRHLSVLVGGFDLAAAEAVSGVAGATLLEAFAGLLNRSLVTVVESPGSESRWSVLESIRAFGLAALEEEDEAAAARERHAAYFVEVAQQEAPRLAGPLRAQSLERLGRDDDNLRAAREWLIAGGHGPRALDFTSALGWFWYPRGRFDEGRQSLERALALPTDSAHAPARGRALTAAARLCYYTNRFEPARVMAEEAVEIAREHALELDLANALYVRALAAQGVGDPAAADFAREAVAHMRSTGDRWGLALTLFYLGTVCVFLGPPEAVAPALAESEALFRELGDSWGVGGTLFYRGVMARRDGTLAEAHTLVDESVQMFRPSGDRWRLMAALDTLAQLTADGGGDPTALRAEAAALRHQLGIAAS